MESNVFPIEYLYFYNHILLLLLLKIQPIDRTSSLNKPKVINFSI